MKKLLALMMALAMVLALAACGSTGTGSAKSAADGSGSAAAGNADGKTYKVGIVNWVDHASLNQIIENLEAELDRQGEALGVTFDYQDYYDNAQADQSVLSQIGANMIADDVDIVVAVASPSAAVMKSALEDTDIPVVFSAVRAASFVRRSPASSSARPRRSAARCAAPSRWALRAASSAFFPVISSPSKTMEPEVGFSNRFRLRRKVLLPPPDGPMTAMTSPLQMSTLIPSSALTSPPL